LPNPNDGHFILNTTAAIQHIDNCMIVDVTGRILFNAPLEKISGHFIIDLNQAVSGIYFISIKAENKSWNKKIVVYR